MISRGDTASILVVPSLQHEFCYIHESATRPNLHHGEAVHWLMNKSQRTELAQQTIAYVEAGQYQSPTGKLVEFGNDVQQMLTQTEYFAASDVNRLRKSAYISRFNTAIEVVNETTLQGIARVVSEVDGPIAALNFASARNPGGGFLNGSQAQEESLARSSALYASQLRAFEFYTAHRQATSLLYSNAMIYSPDCPVIRDDLGTLLETPTLVSFITCAAPNAGAIRDPKDKAGLAEALQGRAECVLAVAASKGIETLILGAWGCGVFRNDPQQVAGVFADHLLRGKWRGVFQRVVFSVLDTSARQEIFTAFEEELIDPSASESTVTDKS